jgi:histone acetyltransferase (RNA polymerase elongator complex component)
MCSFCNQHIISGTQTAPTAKDVKRICTQAAAEIKNPENTEIAFFGGSFTAIPEAYMTELLEAAQDFIGEGKFRGIRISTRPDCISRDISELLKEYGVTSVELGAQSMKNSVLTANDRGHTAEDVENASRIIREYGFELGLQMMVGLYTSTFEDERETMRRISEIHPDTLRIYPVVILEGTKLGSLYKSGEYKCFSFDEVVELCADFMETAEQCGINVIKVGLHASEFVEKDMLGGFYHPAFRELCEGRIYRRRLFGEISGCGYAKVSVPQKNLSKALGQKKCNIEYFKSQGTRLEIIPDPYQTEYFKILLLR